MNNEPVIIVGAGLAGYTVAKELRKLAPDQAITLVTADSGAIYSKPMLSNALSQGLTAQALIQSSARDHAAKLNLEAIPFCAVTAIRPSEHILETQNDNLAYRHLVLALGAKPRSAGFVGHEHALSINHLDDYARFRERLLPGSRVVILGAGLVGCEFANDLAASGYGVTIVETSERPLSQMAPPALSQRLQNSLSRLGVQWHCGSGASELTPLAKGYAITLNDGTCLQADLVLSATGLTPETSLAKKSGLKIGRGIQVDDRLATSATDIHALGDCAETGDMLLPYVLPLIQQARVLASILSGIQLRLTLPALPVAVKTPACPLVLCPPAPHSPGSWHCEHDNASGASYRFEGLDGALLGFGLAGDACSQRRQLAGLVPALLA
jgi:rubredoxin-NAD+ reductase